MPDRPRRPARRTNSSRGGAARPLPGHALQAPEVIEHGARKPEAQHRRDLCAAGRWMQERGFISATEGNLSVRLDAQRILTTPTGVGKCWMQPGDLVIVDLHGRTIGGNNAPSSEMAMHLTFYLRRPDVNAICHAHPPTATGYAAAGIALDKALLSEIVLTLGAIPLAPYATPGTAEVPEALAPLIEHYDAILLANHGVVTCGPDLLTALYYMENAEHCARVSLVTEVLGRRRLLTRAEVEKLLAARPRYGLPPATSDIPRPLAAESSGAVDDRVSLTREELAGLIEDAVRSDRHRR